jgi:hypothetical protein
VDGALRPFAPRKQVGTQHFAGARGQKEVAHEANHRHAQHDGVSRVADRFQQRLPAKRAQRVGDERHANRRENQRRSARVDGAPGLGQVNVAKEQPQQRDRRRENKQGLPAGARR